MTTGSSAFFAVLVLTVAASLAASSPALAKPAQCFTTDDGYFSCEFVATDKDGSFEITGEGAAYMLLMEQPGIAFGFVNVDGRNVSLPGRYVRSREDGACWENLETEAKICAWQSAPHPPVARPQ